MAIKRRALQPTQRREKTGAGAALGKSRFNCLELTFDGGLESARSVREELTFAPFWRTGKVRRLESQISKWRTFHPGTA